MALINQQEFDDAILSEANRIANKELDERKKGKGRQEF